MLRRLDSSHGFYRMTRVTTSFSTLESELCLQNIQTSDWQTQLVCTQKNQLFLLQWRTIGSKFSVFNVFSSGVMPDFSIRCFNKHWDKAELCFLLKASSVQCIGHIIVVKCNISYRDHGTLPHIFTLGLLQGRTDLCFSNPNLIKNFISQSNPIPKNRSCLFPKSYHWTWRHYN